MEAPDELLGRTLQYQAMKGNYEMNNGSAMMTSSQEQKRKEYSLRAY